MSLCSRQVSPLQRRAVRGVAFVLLLIVGLTYAANYYADTHHIDQHLLYLLAILVALCVTAAIVTVVRYLRREPDEYLRLLVTRSLLCGLGAVMLVNAVAAVFAHAMPTRGLVEILNIDVFCITMMVSLRLQLRRAS